MSKFFRKPFRVNTIFSSLQNGFTIVELVIYMSMLSILLTVLAGVFTQIIDTQLESQATSRVEEDGRFILSRLQYDLNRASAISSPALGATGSSLQFTVNGVSYTYDVTGGGDLRLTNDLGTNNLNGYDASVSAMTFKQIGNSGGRTTVQVNFRLTSKTKRPAGPEVRNFQTTLGIRY